MNREDLIAWFCIAFLLGVALLSELIGDNLAFYLGGLGMFLSIYCWCSGKMHRKIYLVFCCGLIFGLLRMLVDLNFGKGNLVDFNNDGKWLQISGQVVSEPQMDANSQSMNLAVKQLDIAGLKESVEGLAKLKLNRYPELNFGDRLVLKAKLIAPENSEAFNYADWLAKDRVFSLIDNAYLIKVDNNCREFECIQLAMIIWRKVIVERLLAIFNEPVAGIVAGILIGVRSTIPDNILNNFQITGLTHILAISGFNITLIINLVTILLANLPRGRRFYICLVLIILFAVLTGLSSSVVRAALMGLMILLVKTMGRKSNVMTVIMLSGFLMVLISPRILAFDVSFQLSFLATLSLIRFSNHFEKIGLSWPKIIREGIMVTLTAQVLTLPISFYNFGKISLIAPLANMLTLPLVPIIMALGFATFLFSVPSLILAKYLGGLTWLITMLMIKIVEMLAKIPFAAVIIGKGSVPLVLIYYLLVFRFFHKSKPEPNLIWHPVPPDQSISSQES